MGSGVPAAKAGLWYEPLSQDALCPLHSLWYNLGVSGAQLRNGRQRVPHEYLEVGCCAVGPPETSLRFVLLQCKISDIFKLVQIKTNYSSISCQGVFLVTHRGS